MINDYKEDLKDLINKEINAERANSEKEIRNWECKNSTDRICLIVG